jgi:hypothetical protein
MPEQRRRWAERRVHAGQEYLDAFERREVERLAAIEEARQRPGSIWFENPKLWDGTSRGSSSPSEPCGDGVGPSGSRTRPDGWSLAVTACACCGRSFSGRRSDARYCGDVCRQRAGRGRCGVEPEEAA